MTDETKGDVCPDDLANVAEWHRKQAKIFDGYGGHTWKDLVFMHTKMADLIEQAAQSAMRVDEAVLKIAIDAYNTVSWNHASPVGMRAALQAAIGGKE